MKSSPALLLLFTLSTAYAEDVYKCNDTWTTNPCEDGNTSSVMLPKISKIHTSTIKEVSTEPEGIDQDRSYQTPVDRDSCRGSQANGTKLLFEEITVKRTIYDNSVLTLLMGYVKNDSSHIHAGKVRILVEQAGRKVKVIYVDSGILPGDRSYFKYRISTNKLTLEHTRPLTLRLLFSPAENCPSLKVSLNGANVIDRRTAGRRGPSLKGSRDRIVNANRNLNMLKQDIQRLKQKHRMSHKSNTLLIGDRNRLLLKKTRICNSSLKLNEVGSARASNIRSKCQEMEQLIRGVGK